MKSLRNMFKYLIMLLKTSKNKAIGLLQQHHKFIHIPPSIFAVFTEQLIGKMKLHMSFKIDTLLLNKTVLIQKNMILLVII